MLIIFLISLFLNLISLLIVPKLKKELKEGKKRWAYYEARFVECNTCTPEMKEKCLMFSEMMCDGDKCKTLIDLEQLINKEDDLK